MISQFTGPFFATGDTALLAATVIGFFFGYFLERGGLGDPHKLTGVFYLTDFTVPKVMFTAILVASAGLYLLSDLKILDLSKVIVVPTFFWPQITAGAIFGVGFVLSGYCPGTGVAGLASGRLDALIALAGIAAGSFLFAVSFPFIEKFYGSSGMDDVTLPPMTGFGHWTVIGCLALIALVMFFIMERMEKKKFR